MVQKNALAELFQGFHDNHVPSDNEIYERIIDEENQDKIRCSDYSS
jgi:hypothetical protein